MIDEILTFLGILYEPRQIIELRALGVTLDRYRQNIVIAGYFDDMAMLAAAAAQLDDKGGNIYVTLNPTHTRLIARARNRLLPRPKQTTADHEIIRRKRILIDCDPRRLSGIPSNGGEHEAAIDRAQSIAAYLSGVFGWPEPLMGSSGNGAHLIYAINLPTDDDGLVKRVLRAAAHAFDDDRVQVDTTCYNPARITKLFGTTCRKGDDCPDLDMPHRRARIITAPDVLDVVPAHKLEEVAALLLEESHG